MKGSSLKEEDKMSESLMEMTNIHTSYYSASGLSTLYIEPLTLYVRFSSNLAQHNPVFSTGVECGSKKWFKYF